MHTPKIIPLIPTQAVPETMPSLPATWPKNAPYSFHVLGKPSGATCNLDCTYCFFLSKEKLYPNGRFRMSDETLETYIRQLLESQNEAWCDFFREHHFLIGLSLDGPQAMHDTYHGECPKNRFIETPDGEPGLNYLCAGYKAFFTHVDKPMRMMAELLRRNRAPAEVMLVLAAEEKQLQKAFAKAGRNEPCPCGSGRKFKQCHGR